MKAPFVILLFQNTSEALKKVVELLQEATQAGAFVLRRAITFAAALALKQVSLQFRLWLM